MTSSRTIAAVGAFSAFVAVALGAFGAHGLEGRVAEDLLEVFETGARYHMYHSLALLAVAWACDRFKAVSFTASAWLFTIGIVVFSGSLYLMTLTGQRWLGAVTPMGGVAFLAGWLVLATALMRAR